MKIKIDDYELNISAKLEYSEKANIKDTTYFLNFLSMVFRDASKYNAMMEASSDCWEWHTYVKEKYSKISHEIYNFLNDMGIYK